MHKDYTCTLNSTDCIRDSFMENVTRFSIISPNFIFIAFLSISFRFISFHFVSFRYIFVSLQFILLINVRLIVFKMLKRIHRFHFHFVCLFFYFFLFLFIFLFFFCFSHFCCQINPLSCKLLSIGSHLHIIVDLSIVSHICFCFSPH